jgi:LacI family transcriptional regulator
MAAKSNISMRGLKTNGRSKFPVVALLVESSRASGRDLLCGIARCAHHHGPWSVYWEPGGLEKAWPKIRSLEIDGIILRDVDKLAEVAALGIPAVVIGHNQAEIPNMVNVITDSAAVGQMGAEHLLLCGFKHFAFCGHGRTGPKQSSSQPFNWSAQREAHFVRRLRQAGFAVHTRVINPAVQSWPEERRRLASWLEALPKPVGLMACNDDCGRQVLEACKLARLSVPDQVGVLGADNDEVVCGLADPPLSSVSIQFERAGYEAALCLTRLLRRRGSAPAKIVVPASHVVARRSTDVSTADDPQVLKALRFVRDHAHEDIFVGDICRAAGVSRRSLEIKFYRELGCTIRRHIQRVRMEQIRRLLIETDLPIGNIAENLGFSDVQHFSRYFRAGQKMTPLAFRRTRSGRVG